MEQTPSSSTFKFYVFNIDSTGIQRKWWDQLVIKNRTKEDEIDSRIDNVDINTLTSIGFIVISIEGTK